jgi:Asp-tRNA(Asn)/Glu-tRNA(Gln) amidotransferase A subunit family amidase
VTPTDLCFLSASELIALYSRRRVSPLEVTRAVLDRIERINPTLNAYCTVVADRALRAARVATAAWRRGSRIGPLLGVPVSIKDLTPTKGIRTTLGSTLFEHHVPDIDGLIVQRLGAAGAIVLGKTNTPEFGLGGTTANAVFGVTRNPWNPSLTCGGSSGGAAAAVAAGLGQLAQGSDFGGSLRIPASFCGVVALRPSPGLIPVLPRDQAWDTLSVQGPITRTVADAAVMLAAVAGRDPHSPTSYRVDGRDFIRAVRNPTVRGLRIAWSGDLGVASVEPEIARIARAAAGVFRTLGARVEEAAPALDGVLDVIRVTRGARLAATFAAMPGQWRQTLATEIVKDIDAGLAVTAAEIGRAERLRTALWLRMTDFLGRYDLILTPTTPVAPFPIDRLYPSMIDGKPVESYFEWFALTYVFSVLGIPAISVPCGFTSAGLPVGLQLVGRWQDEATVLRAAAAFERAQPWSQRRPPDGA